MESQWGHLKTRHGETKGDNVSNTKKVRCMTERSPDTMALRAGISVPGTVGVVTAGVGANVTDVARVADAATEPELVTVADDTAAADDEDATNETVTDAGAGAAAAAAT